MHRKTECRICCRVFCYFRSTYEVLIDADEHLSTLLGPADLLAHLKALVDLLSAQLVSTIKYLVCWPMASWQAGDAREDLNTGLLHAGPNGSMRPPLRMSHAEMPWTGEFDRLHQQAPYLGSSSSLLQE